MSNMDAEKVVNEEMMRANDLKSILAFILGTTTMSPDGGISMCITCKKNGRDKYKDTETGQEWDLCESCLNNMTNAYKER